MKQYYLPLVCLACFAISAPAQNVGIGTTTPTQKLDVNGTIKGTGFQMPTGAAAGYNLTSDSSGNGSWQQNPISSLIATTVAAGCPPPSQVGSVATGTYPFSFAVSGSYAYVVDEASSDLRIYDVSNPASPTQVGSVATGSYPISVAVLGSYAYVVDYVGNDLRVYNISNPASPTQVGSVATGSFPISVAVSGSYAYVVDAASNDLRIYNVSNPASPAQVGSVATGSYPYSVTVSGSYAYVVDQSSSDLRIYDVSNPASPIQVGSVATGSDPFSVAVSGSYAYVVDGGSSDLSIYNVSNPASPAQVGSVATGSFPTSVAVSGSYAYVVEYYGNDLRIYNISNPASPSQVSSVAAGSNPYSVAVLGSYVYVVDLSSDSLRIYNNSCTDAITINASTGALGISTNVTGPAGPAGPAGPTGLLSSGAAAGNTPYWNGSAWVVNSSNIYNNGGNVGIGSTAPAAMLSVITTSSDGNVGAWGSGQFTVGQDGTTAGALGLSYSTTNNAGYISSLSPDVSWRDLGYRANNHIFYAVGITEAMRVTTTGALAFNGAANYGSAGQVLQSNGNAPPTWVSASTLAGNNIYNSNGTLTGARTVTMSGNTLNFTGGNVGIGTTAPQGLLSLADGAADGAATVVNGIQFQSSLAGGFGHAAIYAVGSTGYNGNLVFATDGDAIENYNPTEKMRITSAGFVGIGTTSPVCALEVAGQTALSIASPRGTYYSTSYGANQSTFNAPDVVAKFDGRVWATVSFDVSSDRRIKDVIGETDNARDLETLTKLCITDYTMKDKIAEGDRPYKKVIAQEVAEVYPTVVSYATDFVPDIFAVFPISYHGNVATVEMGRSYGIKSGDQIRIVNELNAKIDVEVTDTANGSFSFTAPASINRDSAVVFVYGRQVHDKALVDYDGLTTLNISATQELYRIIKAQQDTIKAQQEQIGSLKSENSSVRSDIDRLKASVETLQQILQSKAEK